MTSHHVVELYRDVTGEYRWRRVKSSDTVAASGESYDNKGDAMEQAYAEAVAHQIQVEDLTGDYERPN